MNPETCDHNYELADTLIPIDMDESSKQKAWVEKEYCDLCFTVRYTLMQADQNVERAGDLRNIRTLKEWTRPQTEREKANSVTPPGATN
jgi:hypothetical protein